MGGQTGMNRVAEKAWSLSSAGGKRRQGKHRLGHLMVDGGVIAKKVFELSSHASGRFVEGGLNGDKIILWAVLQLKRHRIIGQGIGSGTGVWVQGPKRKESRISSDKARAWGYLY